MPDIIPPPASPSPSLLSKISVFISKNIPYLILWLTRQITGLIIALRNFIIQLIHDTIGR